MRNKRAIIIKFCLFEKINAMEARQSDNVDNAQELTDLVTQMLEQMQTRFGQMNGNIVSRIDEMSKKIDELEGSIGELVKEAQEEPELD